MPQFSTEKLLVKTVARHDFTLQLTVDYNKRPQIPPLKMMLATPKCNMSVFLLEEKTMPNRRNCKQNKTSEICHKCKLAICGKCIIKVSKR